MWLTKGRDVTSTERLSGKVAIVTGAARGTGAEIAKLFCREGARVVIADLRIGEATALASGLGPMARACEADVGSEAGWEKLVSAAHAWGRISVLVNNAAIISVATIDRLRVDDVVNMFRVNQLGPLLGMKAVLDDMKENGGGSIVNIGSIDGLTSSDMGLSGYGATKWALRGMTKMAAMELGRYGIRVNCIHPDGGNPEMSAPFLGPGVDPREAMERHVHQILQPPRGQPRNDRMRDIANMALFLASDEGNGCTGGDFPVDGGYTAGRCFGG